MARKINLIFRVTLVLVAAACIPGAGARVSRASDAVVLEVEADTPVVRLQGRQRVVVRALVRPGAVEKRRIPLAVALVLDRSGSMSSDGKMENARLGAMEALKMLGDRDVATVVAYDTSASVVVPAHPASDKTAFSGAISRLRPEGSTALYDGVRVGADQLRPFMKEGYIPRVILLSDGIANVGPSSTHELATFGRALAERGVTITTIGLGLDYNEDLMTVLAAESGGNAYFARHAKTLPEIFARDMEDAVTLTARKVRVTLNCGDGIRPIGAVGRSALPEKDGSEEKSVEISIDNLYGTEKYALFEIEVFGIRPIDPAPFFDAATIKLEYLDPATDSVIVREAPLRLALTKDDREVEKNRRADIVAQTEIARNAEIREEVVRLSDEGRIAEAALILQDRTDALRKIAPAQGMPAPQFEAEARKFESMQEELQSFGFSSETRKETLNQAYIQKNQQAAISDDEE
ncbi:MAG: VWA domain-containing protein [Synergistaceae bacterium]|jgi:Ca-activated chloride channel family protein|nr:VWA domain-containing protein [Synergistaceae bacterium]